VQAGGVLTKGQGAIQIKHKKETFWAERDEARNIKLNRTIKNNEAIWSKIVGKLQRPKEGRKIKTDGPFAVEEPKSLLRTHCTDLLA
jgi:hypothetical protein